MKTTQNLKLPQYTGEDIFDLQDVNKAYYSIDKAYGNIDDTYKEVVNIKDEIPKTNATAEVINARGGKETLGKRLDEFGSQLDTKTNELNSKIDEIANTGTTIEVVQKKVEEMSEQGLIQAYTIADATIEPKKTNFMKDGINKLDFSKITDNSFMDLNGNIATNSSYFITDYIEIPYGKQAVLTCKNEHGKRRTCTFRMTTVYDVGRTIITAEGNNSSSYFWKNDISNSTKLVRFSIAKSTYSDWQIDLIDSSIEYDGTAIDSINGCSYFSEFEYKLEDKYIENKNISILKNDVGYLKKDEIENILPTIIYVSPSYSSSDTGYGVDKFNSIIAAHESIIDNSKNKPYKIIVKPGKYNFGGIWTGDRNEVYVGILLKDYVYIESENIERPQDYIITWNGADDFPLGTIISDRQALKRCPFHITQDSQHCSVSGFTFNCSNIRYCIHPETNAVALGKTSEGYLQEIDISNNIFNWGGRPNCENQSNIAVACGLAPASKINFKRCKFNSGNLGFHNNEWHTYYGDKPFLVQGSYALVEECVFDNQPITYSVMFTGADTYEVLHIKNCRGISAITVGDKIQSQQKLTLINEGSEVKGVITNPFS